MPDAMLAVCQLGKRYRVGRRERYRTLRDSLAGAWRPRRRIAPTEFWAIQDVSFDVRPGEVVGIIGRNGAGKSTLLRILSRITEPTRGYADIRGRVGSLLDVGTGFHFELTGRENIYLSGAILGMPRREIDRRFDEMVAFAEVEPFIDTAVKCYSSGMYLRLAFAVAAHLEPDMLLVDEVLAVGDAAFQRKCLGKMESVAGEGRTVLFVSHNMGAVTRLCQRSLWLHEGKVVFDGPSQEAVSRYQAACLAGCASWERRRAIPEDAQAVFVNMATHSADGALASVFQGDEPIRVVIRYQVRRHLMGCQIGLRITDAAGVSVLTTADSDAAGASALPKAPGRYETTVTIPGGLLAPGTYQLLLAAHLPERAVYDVIDGAIVVQVSAAGSLTSLDGRLGVVAPLIPWQVSRCEP